MIPPASCFLLSLKGLTNVPGGNRGIFVFAGWFYSSKENTIMFRDWLIKRDNAGFSIWDGKILLHVKNEHELWKQLRGYGVPKEKYDKLLQQVGERGEGVLTVHVPGRFQQGVPVLWEGSDSDNKE
jgi:hypothetical protein